MQVTHSLFIHIQNLAAVATLDQFSSIENLIEKGKLFPPAVRHEFDHTLLKNTDEEAERVWKVLKAKTSEPQFCVEVIKSCELVEKAPLGFIRRPKIEIPNKDPFTIEEHILLKEVEKTALFVQLDGEFLAINGIKKREGNWVFHGTYVYGQAKEKAAFDDEMSLMAKKIFEFNIKSHQKE